MEIVVPPAEERRPVRRRKRTKKRLAGEGCVHNIYTHFPKDPNCEICRMCKTDRAPCRSKGDKQPHDLPTPKKWGDALTGDHAILNDADASRSVDKVLCVLQDIATKWEQAYPCKQHSTHETKLCIKRFYGPETECKHAYRRLSRF